MSVLLSFCEVPILDSSFRLRGRSISSKDIVSCSDSLDEEVWKLEVCNQILDAGDLGE